MHKSFEELQINWLARMGKLAIVGSDEHVRQRALKFIPLDRLTPEEVSIFTTKSIEQ